MFQKVKRVTMRNLFDTIFCINTSVLQNFHICMSVPLKLHPAVFTFVQIIY